MGWGVQKKAYVTIFQVQFSKNHKIQFGFFCMRPFSLFSSFFSCSPPLQKVLVPRFLHLLPFPSSLILPIREGLAPVCFIYICHASVTAFRLGFSLLLSLPSFVHFCLFLSCYIKTEWGRNNQLNRM